VAAVSGASIAALAVLGRRSIRVRRGVAALRLAARGGARYASNAPRLFASAGEHREQLRNDLALQTAEDVAATLGTMKGVLMKLGQMASYVDDALSPAARRTLSRLQDSVPPMSAELAARVVTEELGQPPEQAFATWDPQPIAAASIGQVHRAITHDGRAVAVKVQYPGIAETIAADLGNVALLRRMLKITAPSQDVEALLAELRERVTEELDYRREARNQQLFARYYEGHPTIHVPQVVAELSTRRVVTSELADGARFAALAGWSQAERDLAAETIYRFVFRSLYEAHAFNGDPHPGNYLFHGGGRVTFLDFGMVKYFTPEEMQPLAAMVKHLCVDSDPEGFRRAMVQAGFLIPDAPVSTPLVVEHMAVFYDTVRERGPRTMTGEYASAVTRKFFDFRSPLAAYARIPRSYVILQRINLGLFALLGELSATADWRRIAEEIWPFFQGPPCTPMGAAEAAWRSRKTVGTHAGSLGHKDFRMEEDPGDAAAESGDPGRDADRGPRPRPVLGEPWRAARSRRTAGPLLPRPGLGHLRAGVQGPAPAAVGAEPAHRALLPGRGDRPGGRAPAVRRVPLPRLPGIQAFLGSCLRGRGARRRGDRHAAACGQARSARDPAFLLRRAV
jgi:predicted unusual protein kinase regulating ubiquinone biosynthesis (AarF/ABC1/UbiB family)